MIITIAAVFAACKSDPDDLQTNKVMLTDSAGINTANASSDTAAVQKACRPVIISKTTSSEKTTTSTSNSSGSTVLQPLTELQLLPLLQPLLPLKRKDGAAGQKEP